MKLLTLFQDTYEAAEKIVQGAVCSLHDVCVGR